MKVIGIENNWSDGIVNTVNHLPAVFLMADTTILKDNKPFFVPDFSKELTYGVALVVRINRLGKNIATRFASRYYDEVTVGLTLCAEDLKAELLKSGLDTSLATSFDNAAIIGQFTPLDQFDGGMENLVCEVEEENGDTITLKSSELVSSVDEIISHISKYYTLKIGDILFAGFTPRKNKITMDSLFKGKINGKEMMTFKTK